MAVCRPCPAMALMKSCCALAVAYLAAACNGHGGTGPVGYGGPALEVTIDGIHLGPAAPDPGSSVSLIDTKNQLAQVTDSQLRILAGSTAAGATCQLGFERFGDGITPIRATFYTLGAVVGGGTPDGTVTPIGGERVIGPGDSWQCAGSSCDGGQLVINVVDSLHVEGYFAATLASDSRGQPASVVCSFYVPMSSYAP